MQTEIRTVTASAEDVTVFTVLGLALLGLRGVPSPGLTAPEIRERLAAAGVTDIGHSGLYRALDDLIGQGLASRERIRRAGRGEGPCFAWHLTARGDAVAAGTARAGRRVLSSAPDASVEDHARYVLALRAELEAVEGALADRIALREKIAIEEGTFTVVPGSMRATKALEEVLRREGVYDEATVEKREIVMAKVDELAADHPDLGAWIDARRAELARERHLRFAARKGR